MRLIIFFGENAGELVMKAKPIIKKYGKSLYVCQSEQGILYAGIGLTAQEAYTDWLSKEAEYLASEERQRKLHYSIYGIDPHGKPVPDYVYNGADKL